MNTRGRKPQARKTSVTKTSVSRREATIPKGCSRRLIRMQKFWNGIECGTPVVAACTVLLLVAFANAAEDAQFTQSTPSTDTIVQNLMAANARRAASLRGYRSKRIYKLDYSGIF